MGSVSLGPFSLSMNSPRTSLLTSHFSYGGKNDMNCKNGSIVRISLMSSQVVRIDRMNYSSLTNISEFLFVDPSTATNNSLNFSRIPWKILVFKNPRKHLLRSSMNETKILRKTSSLVTCLRSSQTMLQIST